MANEIIRIFDVEDDVVLTEALVFANALSRTYLPYFKAFMAVLYNEIFLEELFSAVEEASEITSDDFIIRLQAKEGADVELVMDLIIFELRVLKIYASKAFAKEPAIFRTFRFDSIREVRHSADKMNTFLEHFIVVLEKHFTTLTGHNIPETKLEEMKTLHANLTKERQEHLASMDQREVVTTHRVRALNHLWELMKEISSVREFALPDDPAAQAIFELPQPPKKENTIFG